MKFTRIFPAFLLAAALTVSAAAALPNGGAESTVTEAMTSAEHWCGAESDTVQMTAEEIGAVNRRYVDGSGTMVFDLAELRDSTDADALRKSLSKLEVPTRDLYVNGRKIHNESYFRRLSRAILATGYTETAHPNGYAIVTTNAPVRAIPTDDVIGYSADDPDDEMQSTTLHIGEPFVIRQRCRVGETLYYWGYFTNLNGWVNAENLGLCASKEEWLDAWQTEPDGDDFLVIAQDRVTTEPSLSNPNTSEVKLTLGTVLKLVPQAEMPESIGERGTWHNYVAYLPVRQSDGTLSREIVLLSQHSRISLGYLSYTPRNILETAFSCLGNRYGWGNMLDSFDCSGFVDSVYRCFGFRLPRNTTYQLALPETVLKLSGLTEEEKLAVLADLPSGTPLYFNGHTMLLCGTENGMPYVISDDGTVSDSNGELNVRRQYSVILTPLSVRRKSGHTWLTDLDAALILPTVRRLDHCTVSVTRTEGAPLVTVRDGETLLTEGTDYTLNCYNDRITVVAAGAYIGAQTVKLPVFCDVPTDHTLYDATEWAAEKAVVQSDTHRCFPNRLCTRAELITMLHRAAGTPSGEGGTLPADVPADAYYTEAVRWAAKENLLQELCETDFSPSAPVNAAQLQLLLRGFAAASTGTWKEPSEKEPVQSEQAVTRADVLQALYTLLQ